MTPEARKLLLDSECLFIRAAREHVTIRRVYSIGTDQGMDLGQMAILAVPALLNEIFELRDLAVLQPPKPFVVDRNTPYLVPTVQPKETT